MKAWSCQASRVITWKETSRRRFVTLLHFFVLLVVSVHIESHLMKEMQVAIEPHHCVSAAFYWPGPTGVTHHQLCRAF